MLALQKKDMAEDDIYKPSGYEPACVILTLFNFVKKGYFIIIFRTNNRGRFGIIVLFRTTHCLLSIRATCHWQDKIPRCAIRFNDYKFQSNYMRWIMCLGFPC